MLDTVVLTLARPRFEIIEPERFSPSANVLLLPPVGSRGKFTCVQNPIKADLQIGCYLPRLTLVGRIHSNGFVVTLRIEFSVPKLILGNNFDELEPRDFADVLDVLYETLIGMGIKVSRDVLRKAPVSAIHYSKNIAFRNYHNLFDGDELSWIGLTAICRIQTIETEGRLSVITRTALR